jgi:hypothetical protein
MSDAADVVTSARELYERDATFRAGIAAWVAERRCDLKLVDLLLEYGLTTQAECARWAATQPDRPFANRSGVHCGPFPCKYKRDFYWYDRGGNRASRDSHDIPRKHFGRPVHYLTDKFKSATDAILFLLDNWKPLPPKRTRKTRPKKQPQKPGPTAEIKPQPPPAQKPGRKGRK